MIIFINGSINSGKSTVGQEVAKQLGYEFVEFDDIRHTIPEPNIDKAIPLVFEKGIKLLNDLDQKGKSAVVAYPLSQGNYDLLISELLELPKVITLSPRLDIVLQNRGNRILSDAERNRIRYHYQISINNPGFGDIIDNSDLSVKETIEAIIDIIKN